uniref:Uncharacterized protein n=1 Tax=Rhizophora mucronata TaxID=61149 RepID=A0A2P2PP82_RHIMU
MNFHKAFFSLWSLTQNRSDPPTGHTAFLCTLHNNSVIPIPISDLLLLLLILIYA